MRLITPLLPWRPAILSPGCSLRFTATKTLTILSTPGSEFIAALQLLLAILELLLDRLDGLVVLDLHRFKLALHLVVGNGELPPFVTLNFLKVLGR